MPAQHNRIVISGTLGSEEIWSTGVNFAPAEGPFVDDQAGLDAWANAAALRLELLTTGFLASYLSTSGSIERVQVQYLGVGGTVVAQAEAAVTDVSGSTNVECPFQCAVALSLRTAIPGASFRGRNYWPALGAQLGPDGRIALSDCVVLAQEWANLLEDLADASPEALLMQPVVYSSPRSVVTPVTSIAVGTVLDTQRRRRNSLLETYAVQEYPPVP